MIADLPSFNRARNEAYASKDPAKIRAWAIKYGMRHLWGKTDDQIIALLNMANPVPWTPPDWAVGRA